MTCPRCGGSNIAIEGCEIYCLSESNSFITSKCFYHFSSKERRLFKKYVKVFAQELFGWTENTCANNVKLIESMYLPENALITKEDQKAAQRELNNAKQKDYDRTKYYDKEKASRYYKKYYQENKEVLKEKNREKARQYRLDNPDKVKEATKKWREKNNDRYLNYQKEYRAKRGITSKN